MLSRMRIQWVQVIAHCQFPRLWESPPSRSCSKPRAGTSGVCRYPLCSVTPAAFPRLIPGITWLLHPHPLSCLLHGQPGEAVLTPEPGLRLAELCAWSLKPAQGLECCDRRGWHLEKTHPVAGVLNQPASTAVPATQPSSRHVQSSPCEDT